MCMALCFRGDAARGKVNRSMGKADQKTSPGDGMLHFSSCTPQLGTFFLKGTCRLSAGPRIDSVDAIKGVIPVDICKRDVHVGTAHEFCMQKSPCPRRMLSHCTNAVIKISDFAWAVAHMHTTVLCRRTVELERAKAGDFPPG